MSHALDLIRATEKHTLRPQKGDRALVVKEVVDYLIENYGVDQETCDEYDCGYSGTYINVEQLYELSKDLDKVSQATHTKNSQNG